MSRPAPAQTVRQPTAAAFLPFLQVDGLSTRRVAEGAGAAAPNGPALSDVTFSLSRGQVHGLVSAEPMAARQLVALLTGMAGPLGIGRARGQIRLGGRRVAPAHPADAQALGIATLGPVCTLLPDQTVGQALLAGREPTLLGLANPIAARRRARAALATLLVDHGMTPDLPIAMLDPARRRLVELARALHRAPRLLVLDHATSDLSEPEAAVLAQELLRVKATGPAILMVTDRLAELAWLADRVTVLRGGRVVARLDQAPPPDLLAEVVWGQAAAALFPPRAQPPAPGAPVLSLIAAGNDALPAGVTMTVFAQQITGIAALPGHGAQALAVALAGVVPFTRGLVRRQDQPVALGSVTAAQAAGVALVCGGQDRAALVPHLGALDNALLPQALGTAPRAHRGRAAGTRARQLLTAMGLPAADLHRPVARLSPGARQAVLLTRALVMEPQLLVLYQPAAALGMEPRMALYATLRAEADAGRAILLISDDLMELAGLCDRVLVMRRGQVVAELPPGATADAILQVAGRDPEQVLAMAMPPGAAGAMAVAADAAGAMAA